MVAKNKLVQLVGVVAETVLKHGSHNQQSHGRGGGGGGGGAAKLKEGKSQTIKDTEVTLVKGSSGKEVNLRPAEGKTKVSFDIMREVMNKVKEGDHISAVMKKAGKRVEVSGTVEKRFRFAEGLPWKGVGGVSVKTEDGSISRVNTLDSVGNMNATYRPNKYWE